MNKKPAVDMLIDLGQAVSSAEARRMIRGGGVSVLTPFGWMGLEETSELTSDFSVRFKVGGKQMIWSSGMGKPTGETIFGLPKEMVVDWATADCCKDEVRRNKKVDVPTEQWQKSVERRLSEIEGFTTMMLNRDPHLGEVMRALKGEK